MDSRKFKQLTKAEQAEVEDIYRDPHTGTWNIILKNHDRCLSEDTFAEVKWELKQMVKTGDYEKQW